MVELDNQSMVAAMKAVFEESSSINKAAMEYGLLFKTG